uniref:SusC/RagA family TonB-linked outer membrane protein n=1 Tax=Mariniphaga sediminis TaxID=1628158 RepID=UPI003567EAAD
MKNFCFTPFPFNGKAKKLILIMKLTVFILFLTLMQVSATVYSQANKFSFRAENKQVVEVLRQIEEHSDFRFFFLREQVDVERRVSVTAREATVEQILDELFQGQPVQYEFANEALIVLTRSDSPIARVNDYRNGDMEQRTVSGKVTDSSEQPLPGVTVVVKGTTQGTVTNADGEYTLANIPENTTLVFSFVGMRAQEVVAGDQTQINIRMEEEAIGLDEVVVTSFGIKRTLKQLTYSTQEVKGENLASVGNPNILGGLQGKVAGVSVTLNSGMPGKAPDIKIRGSRSLTGDNAPLYVVDGMPVAGGDRAADFNPNDIESINILKGPAASALYGLRASNGVVVITTKSGSGNKGKPSISFDTHYSIDKVGMLPDLQMEFAQGENGIFNPNSIYTWGPRISTMSTYVNQLGEQEEPAVYDNDKAFFKTGWTQNSNLTFAKSGDFGNYLIGIGRNDQKGIVPNTGTERT